MGDFVARIEDFRELVHEIAMQIAAFDPKFIHKEDAARPKRANANMTFFSLAGYRCRQAAACVLFACY